jgi:hypothetical protein
MALKPQHKKLEREWYEKLRESGFVDIEDTTTEERPLISWHNMRFKNKAIVQREALQDYYARAKEVLATYKFDTLKEHKIWELHSEGVSINRIEKALTRFKAPNKREYIRNVINKVAKGIK